MLLDSFCKISYLGTSIHLTFNKLKKNNNDNNILCALPSNKSEGLRISTNNPTMVIGKSSSKMTTAAKKDAIY